MDPPSFINKLDERKEPLVAIQSLDACRVLVINSKGGSGKTTVSTNLAAWLSGYGEGVVLIDADKQGSASYWLTQRPSDLSTIFGVTIEENSRITKSYQWRAPRNTNWLITDAAPGLSDVALNELIQKHDIIVVPVLPSDIDIRATARFISGLLLCQSMRRKRRPVAVIANRVKQRTAAWENLEKFLSSLDIPHLATLRDSQNYVRAYGEGRGVADYLHKFYQRDQQDWELFLRWLDAQQELSMQNDDDIESALSKSMSHIYRT